MKTLLKRIVVVLIGISCMTYLAGCQIGTTSKNPEEPIKQADKEIEQVKEEEIATAGNVELKELAIQYKGNILQISGSANEEILQDLFGTAEEKKVRTYTAEDNMDPHTGKTTIEYRFPGMIIRSINTLEDKNRFYVYEMEISDPKYTTPRSIKVGDSLDELKEGYPEARQITDSDGEGYYLYNPVDHFDAMGFTIVDNKISKIKIYTLLE